MKRFERYFTIACTTFIITGILALSLLHSPIVQAQALSPTVPINFTGGSPGCTVFVAPVTGQRVYVSSGLLAIPAAGTGLSIQFVALTGGVSGGICPSNNTLTAITGFFAGAQSGSSAVIETLIPLAGSPAMVTPLNQGLAATISAGTGAGQSVGGYLNVTQQ